MGLFHLNIVTPVQEFFNNDISKLIVRTVNGDLEVLHNMSSVVSILKIGKIEVFFDEKWRVAAVDGGYINVNDNDVTIVAKDAEWADEIDIVKAEKAKSKVETQLQQQRDKGMDVVKAELALKRVLNRIDVSEYYKKKK